MGNASRYLVVFVSGLALAPLAVIMLAGGLDYHDRRQAAAVMRRDLQQVAVGSSLADVEKVADAADSGFSRDHPYPSRGYDVSQTGLLDTGRVRDSELVVAWAERDEARWFVIGQWSNPYLTCQMELVVEQTIVKQIGDVHCEGTGFFD